MSQSLFDIHYKNFEQYFLQNQDKPWNQWLVQEDINEASKKDKTPDKSMNGKQGYVGILRHPQNKSLSCLYKISKVDDNVVEHEYKILKGLEPLAQYCPHFHKAYGIVSFDSNLIYGDNPLAHNTKSKIVRRPMLLMQYVKSKYDFNDMIQDENVKDDYILNVMKQVILCIYLAQQYRFTHYDLHTENILIRNCSPNMHMLYLLDEDTQFLTPTYGYVPNIIDFGFSYCDVPDNTLTCTLVHTQQGFTSSRFDPYSDIKLFFISTVDDIAREEYRKAITPKLQNISRNLFSGMNVQWGSGWDNSKQITPVKIVHELVREYVKPSVLFSKSDLWFDTIQLLIQLPLSPLPYHDLEKCFTSFIQEFVKFEERIVSKTLLNYILKLLVQQVKSYRTSYLKGGEESTWAILEIKRHFLEEYTQLVNYHVPSVDYEKMVCSLLMMVECLEGLFYEYLQKRYQEKDKQYEILRCTSIIDYYKILEYNFPTRPKPLSNKTSIFVIDHVNRQSKTIHLTKEHANVCERLSTPELVAKYIRSVYEASCIDS
jgi:hypothetical protein